MADAGDRITSTLTITVTNPIQNEVFGNRIAFPSNVLAQILEERKLQFTIETGLEIQSIRTANSTTTVKISTVNLPVILVFVISVGIVPPSVVSTIAMITWFK